MSPRHTNYSRGRSARETDRSEETTTVGEPPKRYVYTKTDDTPIRIRKGPGLNFEHNGKYIDTQRKVSIVDVQNGFGLLQAYEATRDGWVCLEFLGEPKEDE